MTIPKKCDLVDRAVEGFSCTEISRKLENLAAKLFRGLENVLDYRRHGNLPDWCKGQSDEQSAQKDSYGRTSRQGSY